MIPSLLPSHKVAAVVGVAVYFSNVDTASEKANSSLCQVAGRKGRDPPSRYELANKEHKV